MSAALAHIFFHSLCEESGRRGRVACSVAHFRQPLVRMVDNCLPCLKIELGNFFVLNQ